jgi:exosortase family protein XrtF
MYSYYLSKNQETADFFACDPITNTVAEQTSYVLNLFGYDAKIEQHTKEVSVKLFVENVYVAKIVEGCTAISIIILFNAFIVAFSNTFLTTAIYCLVGSLLIYIVNIFRIAFIGVALYKYPQYQHILHDIIFPVIIYGAIFILWFIWIKQFSKLKK